MSVRREESPIAQINELARKCGMSYGAYVAWTEPRKVVLTKDKD